MCDIYLALSRRLVKRITAKNRNKRLCGTEQNTLRAFMIKRVVVSREKSTERERTRKRLNDDDLIGFRERQRTKTNNCGERIFFEFFSFFFTTNVLHFF